MRPRAAMVIALWCVSLLWFALPEKAGAQCSGQTPMLGVISGVTGNPFQAEIKRTFEGVNAELLPPTGEQKQFVARDSEGRIRTELSTGKYKVVSGAGAGTEMEQRRITICDPVKKEWIDLDTLNKTATIRKVSFSVLGAKPGQAVRVPAFQCSRQLTVAANTTNLGSEELGHRTIEGVDAIGTVQRHSTPIGSNGTGATKQRTTVTETWCSDELGAVILRVIGTEERSSLQTIAMVNIQKSEPDAKLFEIPADYRVVERVDEPVVGRGMFGVGSVVGLAPASEAAPASAPRSEPNKP